MDIQTTASQPFILLPTFINGKGPFGFLLDTGAGICIVTEELARSLNVRGVVTKEAVGAGGTKMSIHVGQVETIAVGRSEAKNLSVGIMKALPRCVGQGVLGYNFLKHFVVTIDCRRGEHTLAAPTDREHVDRSLLPFMPLRLARPDRPLIVVDVLVHARNTYQFFLDTGASQTIVSPVLAQREGIRSRQENTIVGAGGTVPGSAGTLKSVRLGEALLGDVPVLIADIFSPLNQAAGTSVQGILGYSVLAEFKVVIDYPNAQLWLQRE